MPGQHTRHFDVDARQHRRDKKMPQHVEIYRNTRALQELLPADYGQ
jgi:hypothetical protein